jgi:hypothetical protein
LESISRSLQLASTNRVGLLAQEKVKWKITEVTTIRYLVRPSGWLVIVRRP